MPCHSNTSGCGKIIHFIHCNQLGQFHAIWAIVWDHWALLLFIGGNFFGPSLFTLWHFFAKLWALFHPKHLVTLMSFNNSMLPFQPSHRAWANVFAIAILKLSLFNTFFNQTLLCWSIFLRKNNFTEQLRPILVFCQLLLFTPKTSWNVFRLSDMFKRNAWFERRPLHNDELFRTICQKYRHEYNMKILSQHGKPKLGNLFFLSDCPELILHLSQAAQLKLVLNVY